MALPLALMIALYVVALFPFAYFRHDDWMMIENGVRLKGDWGSLWEPTIHLPHGESVWFFRPLFKGINLVFYELFGLSYLPWLFFHLLCTLAALVVGARVLERLTGDRRRGVLFVTLFAASLHLHVGSLLWVGEGMMNCPQLLLLVLSLHFFLRAWEGPHRRGAEALAVGLWALALGFKESALFHMALVGAVVWCERPWRELPLGARLRAVAPFAILGGAYAVFRLGVLPVNPGYLPEWEYLPASLLRLGAGLLLPILTLAGAARRESLPAVWEGARRRWLYLPFLALSTAPYIAHSFFSPGWFLGVGYFTLFVACLPPWGEMARWGRMPATAGLAAGILCWLATLGTMYRAGWWEWHRAQRDAVAQIRALPPDREEIQLLNCPEDNPPGVSFYRVVGGPDAIHYLWRLLHGRDVRVVHLPCLTEEAPGPRAARLRWRFPELARTP